MEISPLKILCAISKKNKKIETGFEKNIGNAGWENAKPHKLIVRDVFKSIT